jgi:hypothetical protein
MEQYKDYDIVIRYMGKEMCDMENNNTDGREVHTIRVD